MASGKVTKNDLVDAIYFKSNCEKYLVQDIVEKLLKEIKKSLENCSTIKHWASEPFNIEYFSRLDNCVKNYYPDFIIEKTNGDILLVEIKPDDQTHKPSVISNNWAKESWIKNTDKWNAAKEFAHKRGMKFVILTEKFLD